jgi:hypothetical protein
MIKNFILNLGTCATNASDRRRALETVSEKYRSRCLALRGLLAFEVLTHVLTKRCTVEYGIRKANRKATSSLVSKHHSVRMAVPYRAKDVASDRSEFGHPDVAILTTHLSYYFEGLSFVQFVDALRKLTSGSIKKETARDIYEKDWLEIDDEVPSELRSFQCINLADAALLHQLHSHLCFNIRVINFWLSNLVLPNETRQFPRKLFASAWDLVGMVPLNGENKNYSRQYATRGFSGTNDSRFLLPAAMKQQDLSQLKLTNADVIDRILSQESPNSKEAKVHFLPPNLSGKELLLQIVRCAHSPGVLLDPGALMVALSNHQVAQVWLQNLPSESSVKAAVFFDEHDTLCCLDRWTGSTMPLELSPYKNRLEDVIVYLDDHHTRGTDLKLPVNVHAAVTLCSGLPKEKLMQTCMRLRQLGAGLQTVCFWAPPEVRRDLSGSGLLDVIRWSIRNTVKMLSDSLLAWASQGLLFSLSQTALVHMRPSGSLIVDANEVDSFLAASAVPEIHQLHAMYNTHRQEERTVSIVQASAIRFVQALDNALKGHPDGEQLAQAAVPEIRALHKAILERCEKYLAQDKRHSNLLDEEQERELDQDKEVEASVQLPGPRTPAAHIETPQLKKLFTHPTTNIDELVPVTHPIEDAFLHTCVARSNPDLDVWDSRIIVTRDYLVTVNEIQISSQRDEFVRVPHYFLSVHSEAQFKVAILVSMREANELLQEMSKLPKLPSNLKVALLPLSLPINRS